MTFARLLLDIRRRAGRIPADVPRPMALEQAAREILATDRPIATMDPVRLVMGGLLGIGEGLDYDATILDMLTPEDVLRIDMLIAGIVDHGQEQDVLPEIRRAIVRPAT